MPYTDSDLVLRAWADGRLDGRSILMTPAEYELACRAGVYDGCQPTGPSKGRLWVRHYGYDPDGPLASSQGGRYRHAQVCWVDEKYVHAREALIVGQRSCRAGDGLNYANHDRLVESALRMVDNLR